MRLLDCMLALVGAVMMTVMTCHAQQLSAPTLQPKRVIEDHFAPDVSVSSRNILKGVLVGSTDSKVSLDQLRTYIPEGHSRSVCLQMTSRDGRYIGGFEYDISSLSSGQYRLAVESQYKSPLAKYRADELAALIVFKDNCSLLLAGDGDLVGVASWGDWSEPSHITLFLNATRLDARIFIPDRGEIYDCEGIDSPVRTTFDTECRVIFSSAKKPSDFVVRLYRFESTQPEVPFRIVIP